MKDIRFEDAFSPVPPVVHARVEESLREVREMSMKKAKPMAAIVLAAILALALIGAAIAEMLGGGVLDYLFGSAGSSDEVRDMVRPVGITHEAEGVKTTIVDALFDGRNIHFGLLVDAAQPCFLVTEAVTANGVPLWRETSSIENMWVGNPLSGEVEAEGRGFSGSLDAAYLGSETPEEMAACDVGYSEGTGGRQSGNQPLHDAARAQRRGKSHRYICGRQRRDVEADRRVRCGGRHARRCKRAV